MSQVTIYLEPELAKMMRQAAEREGVSQSRWLAKLVAERLRTTWSDEVAALAGAWADAPESQDLRRQQGKDVPREPL